MPTPEQRNPRPFKTALGIFGVLTLLLVVVSVMRGGDPRAVGTIAFDLLAGCVVLALWARNAKSRWTKNGWAWRTPIALVLTSVVLTILQVAGRT